MFVEIRYFTIEATGWINKDLHLKDEKIILLNTNYIFGIQPAEGKDWWIVSLSNGGKLVITPDEYQNFKDKVMNREIEEEECYSKS